MDFGVLGLDKLVGPPNGDGAQSQAATVVSSSPPLSSPLVPENSIKPVVHGSRFIKQERTFDGEDDRGASKMAKPGDLSAAGMITMPLLHQGTPLLRSNALIPGDNNNNNNNNFSSTIRPQGQMLSFSSTQSEVTFLSRSHNNNGGLLERSSRSNNTNFPPYFQPTIPTYAYSRNPGMHGGALTGINNRGPFTQSQLVELEHQAWIFRYLSQHGSIPSNLYNSLKKSLYPNALTYSSAGSYAPNSYGWGTFHLGYSSNADPEPGRCRRTDGKKWRCSRDAVPDQKYCERHINRGRHRSRKPVEGRPTSAAASGETATSNSVSLVVPMTSSSLSTTSVMATTGVGVSSNSLVATNQYKTLQSGGAAVALPSSSTLTNRVQGSQDVLMMSCAINPKPSETTFTFPKQDISFGESSHSMFGLVPSDSLFNPSQQTSFLDFTDQQTQDQNPLHQFIDEWPKDDSTHSVITWADELKSDWTQLSMSIPIASTEFSSSSSSPAQDKLALSPLRLSNDFDSTQMGLAMETTQKQTDWTPVSWEKSMGGPLGEVLTNSTSTNVEGSPQMGSSPTGVLQKTTFCSLSNSSSTSSPRVENTKTLYEEALGSAFMGSSSVPSKIPGK